MISTLVIAGLVFAVLIAWAAFCSWVWLKLAEFYEREGGD